MTNFLIVLFALLGLASAAQFSIPLKKSGSVREKMIREGRYKEYLDQEQLKRTQQLNTGKQQLFDQLDEYYLVDINLGTPVQYFTVAIDTTSSTTWVLDVNCQTPDCQGSVLEDTFKETYNSTASSSYVDMKHNFMVPYQGKTVYGGWGEEQLTMAGLVVDNQDFVSAVAVPDVYVKQPVDGVLGLGWPAQALPGTKTVLQNLTPQLDKPVFTIWMQKIDTATMKSDGAVLYGGIDYEACDQQVNYVPLAVPGTWEFNVDGFSMGTFSRQLKEKAITATGSGWTGVPNAVFANIVQATKAVYDWAHQVYTVPCTTTGTQPDITLTIGGNYYTIKSDSYVVDLEFKNGQCALAFFGLGPVANKPAWILGDAFIRGYCHIFDFGKSRIGFSKFVQRD